MTFLTENFFDVIRRYAGAPSFIGATHPLPKARFISNNCSLRAMPSE